MISKLVAGVIFCNILSTNSTSTWTKSTEARITLKRCPCVNINSEYEELFIKLSALWHLSCFLYSQINCFSSFSIHASFLPRARLQDTYISNTWMVRNVFLQSETISSQWKLTLYDGQNNYFLTFETRFIECTLRKRETFIVIRNVRELHISCCQIWWARIYMSIPIMDFSKPTMALKLIETLLDLSLCNAETGKSRRSQQYCPMEGFISILFGTVATHKRSTRRKKLLSVRLILRHLRSPPAPPQNFRNGWPYRNDHWSCPQQSQDCCGLKD